MPNKDIAAINFEQVDFLRCLTTIISMDPVRDKVYLCSGFKQNIGYEIH